MKCRPVSIVRELYQGRADTAADLGVPQLLVAPGTQHNKGSRSEAPRSNISRISRPRLRIGAICSANACAIQTAHPLLKDWNVALSVVTYKPSGIERFCYREDIPFVRLVEPGKEAFSERTANWLKDQEVDLVILFQDRLLSAAFVDSFHTINIHPGL